MIRGPLLAVAIAAAVAEVASCELTGGSGMISVWARPSR